MSNWTANLLYSSDVSLEHCHGAIIYKTKHDCIGVMAVYFIEDREGEQWNVVDCVLYDEVDDWMDIDSLNQSMDSQHQPGELTTDQKVALTVDVIDYWGPQSAYNEFLTLEQLEQRLITRGVMKPSE